MKRGARYGTGVLVLSALIVGLVASPAMAKKTAYAGPLTGSGQQPGSGVSFKVDSKRKGGVFRPVAVLKFKYFFLVASCSQGPLQSSAASGVPSIPVNKRRFENSTTFENLTYEIRGRIPRKGPAEGTIRVSGFYTLPDTGVSTCESTVPWTAEKVDD